MPLRMSGDGLDKLQNMPAIWDRSRVRVLNYTGETLIEEAKQLAPRDTGRRLNRIKLKINAPATIARVMAPIHLAVLDAGRRPGQKAPKASSLIPWVKRAAGAQRRSPSGKYIPLGLKNYQYAGIAFAIAQSIGERGIEAREFFLQAYNNKIRNNRNWERQVSKILREEVARGN